MALLSASLSVRGAEAGRLEVARQEGQPVSAAIAAAKQQLIALVNAEVAKEEGAAAAAEGEKGARARAGGAARGGARELCGVCFGADFASLRCCQTRRTCTRRTWLRATTTRRTRRG